MGDRVLRMLGCIEVDLFKLCMEMHFEKLRGDHCFLPIVKVKVNGELIDGN